MRFTITVVKKNEEMSVKNDASGDEQIRSRPYKTFAVRGEEVCPVRTFFGQGGKGFFRCGRPHFLAQKTSDFLKFMVCPRGKGGGG